VLYGNSEKPKELFKKEQSIFGSTEQSSLVHISLAGQLPGKEKCDLSKGKKIQELSTNKHTNILEYLAYGSYKKESCYCLEMAKKFSFLVYVPANLKDEITACLNALLTFGGVGSRSRNGFGSLCCSVEKLAQAKYSKKLAQQQPTVGYPTLNCKSKLFVTKKTYDNWEGALSEIGEVYKKARCSLDEKHNFKYRSILSLPIKGNENRRPKQFLLHVAKQEKKYLGRILSLPILFEDQQKYDNVIKEMHESFRSSETMTEKTDEILKLMELT
jgi:CRISPR-associated protein Cmr1